VTPVGRGSGRFSQSVMPLLTSKEKDPMYARIGFVILALSALSGCASVPMQTSEASHSVKEFKAPANGNAGLYVYRSGIFGAALKKDIFVDGVCLGESASNVLFYKEVKGDMDHKISTESEFSPNDLVVKTQSGKNYLVRQSALLRCSQYPVTYRYC
jgi:hypothetical protein